MRGSKHFPCAREPILHHRCIRRAVGPGGAPEPLPGPGVPALPGLDRKAHQLHGVRPCRSRVGEDRTPVIERGRANFGGVWYDFVSGITFIGWGTGWMWRSYPYGLLWRRMLSTLRFTNFPQHIHSFTKKFQCRYFSDMIFYPNVLPLPSVGPPSVPAPCPRTIDAHEFLTFMRYNDPRKVLRTAVPTHRAHRRPLENLNVRWEGAGAAIHRNRRKV